MLSSPGPGTVPIWVSQPGWRPAALELDHGTSVHAQLRGDATIFLARIGGARAWPAADIFERDRKQRHALRESRGIRRQCVAALLECIGEMLDELGGLKHGHF